MNKHLVLPGRSWSFRGISLLVVLFFLLFPIKQTSAHSLDMYAQDQSIQIDRGGLLVDWKIVPGPILGANIWLQADSDQDGKISQAEAQDWLDPFISHWSLSLDGQSVQPELQGVVWPDSPDQLQSGEQPIEIKLVVDWPSGLTGSHVLKIHNAFQESISLNAYTLKTSSGISFSEPSQSNGLLDVTLSFTAVGASSSSPLTTWESGQPNLTGLSGTLAGMAGSLAGPSSTQTPASSSSGPASALAGLVRTQNFSFWFLLGAFLLSLALGSLHALTPGHGKTLVAAYLVGSHGRVRDAIFLGSIVTLTHTGSVLAFGLLTLLASRFIFPTLIAPWLEIISGLVIVVFSLVLLVIRIRPLWANYRARRQVRRTARPGSAHLTATLPNSSSAPSNLFVAEIPAQAVLSPQSDHLHPGISSPHSHPHDHSHAHEHLHTHEPINAAEKVTWKSLLTLGISGGLVPCPDAIAILVVAVAVGRIPFGMLLIVAFSLGLALVLIGIGIAMVHGARLISRSKRLSRFSHVTPLLSAIVVFGLGIGLSWNAFHSLKLSSAAIQVNAGTGSNASQSAVSALPKFNVQDARVLYLSLDDQSQYQLNAVSLADASSHQLTHEPGGVYGFALSPDGKTILYTLLNQASGSSFKLIDIDGSNPRLVLDCSQAQCQGPVWYPAGGKIIYERLDYSRATTVPMFTLWWLDLSTGQTEPVFQDQAFPGLSPAFSPDGRWLSYVSPSTNSIQVYDLVQAQSVSIHISNRSYAQQIWSPSTDAILYWAPASSDPVSALHVNLHDLSSGRDRDLGGVLQQADYLAAWSPDGQWIAIIRDLISDTNVPGGEMIWLVHPDGTQGHVLIQGQDSYSDLGWSPDGRYLLFDQTPTLGSGPPEVLITDVGTGQSTRLVDNAISPVILP